MTEDQTTTDIRKLRATLAAKDAVIANLRDRIDAAAEIAESYGQHSEIKRILDALEGRDGDE